MSPESFDTTTDASESTSIAVPRSVRPVRSRIERAASPAACITDDAASLSFGEPTSQTCSPCARKRAARSREMRRRPALRRSVLGAGAQHDDRPVGRADASRARPRCDSRDRERAPAPAASGSSAPGAARQRGEAIDEARQRLAIEPARVGQQAVAELAHVAGAPRDAREPRHQRRLPRVRQHDRARVARRLQVLRRARAARAGRAVPCASGLSITCRMPRMRAYTPSTTAARARRRPAPRTARARARSAARKGSHRRPRTARRRGCVRSQ